MANNKYNQFKQHRMKEYKPDESKLIKIGQFIQKQYGFTVFRENILLFSRYDGHFVKFANNITEKEYKKYTIHVPDIMFFIGDDMWVIEVDGSIHFTRESVAKRDKKRDSDYDVAGLNWRKISEWEVLMEHGLKPERGATAAQIIPSVRRIIESAMEKKYKKRV